MPVRLVITKATSTGEQITGQIDQCHAETGEEVLTKEEVYKYAEEMGSFMDVRTTEMNVRMLEAYGLGEFIEQKWGTEIWQVVVSILDIFAGRQQASQVLQRWQATDEETADLERIRLAASNGETVNDNSPA